MDSQPVMIWVHFVLMKPSWDEIIVNLTSPTFTQTVLTHYRGDQRGKKKNLRVKNKEKLLYHMRSKWCRCSETIDCWAVTQRYHLRYAGFMQSAAASRSWEDHRILHTSTWLSSTSASTGLLEMFQFGNMNSMSSNRSISAISIYKCLNPISIISWISK